MSRGRLRLPDLLRGPAARLHALVGRRPRTARRPDLVVEALPGGAAAGRGSPGPRGPR